MVPYDWAACLHRLTSKAPASPPPLEGISRAGTGSSTPYARHYINAREASTGVYADASVDHWRNAASDGHIDDVLVGSVSDKAGLGPGMQIIAVNGRQFSASLLGDAISAAKGTTAPIELIVTNTGYYKTVKLEYHDGLRFPHLERVDGTPDYLGEILTPMTK